MLKETTSRIINPGKNVDKCPVTSCSLKTSPDCKVDYAAKDITIKGSNIFVLSNVEAGFTSKLVCLVCKNSQQTSS